MLLNHQHEAGDAVDMDQAAAAELHFEELLARLRLGRDVDDASALLVLAVTLHVEHTVEALLGDVDDDGDAVGQAADHHFGLREIGTEFGVIWMARQIFQNRISEHAFHACQCFHYPQILTALHLRIAGVAGQALAHRLMIGRIAQRIDAAHLRQARIFTTAARHIAEAIVRAILIGHTAGALRLLDAFALSGQHIAVLHRAHAAAALVDDETALQCAHAMAGLVDAEAELLAARCAALALVDRLSGRTDAVAVAIAHVALVEATQGFCKTRASEVGSQCVILIFTNIQTKKME